MKARTAVKVVWGSVVFCAMMMRDRRRADRDRRRATRDRAFAREHSYR